VLVLLPLLLAQPPAAPAPTDEGLSKKMLPIYVREAEAYSLAVESAPTKKLELKKDPVFEWLNPARNTQQGAVLLWLRDGRPAALGCFFSYPHRALPGRVVMHEMHALDPEKLVVKRDSPNKWEPEAGLKRKELAGAPPPAATPAARQVQIRRLAQEFGGYSFDREKKRWELRLLSTPLYRYPTARTGVVDGGLFALVSNAGTDPEVLLVIEAREDGGKLKWEYACGRFSDWELHVERKGEEVWSSVSSPDNPFHHDPLHLYRIYPEKIVTLEGETVARLRPGPNGPVVVPLEKKP
jgi:hypothetical protein